MADDNAHELLFRLLLACGGARLVELELDGGHFAVSHDGPSLSPRQLERELPGLSAGCSTFVVESHHGGQHLRLEPGGRVEVVGPSEARRVRFAGELEAELDPARVRELLDGLAVSEPGQRLRWGREVFGARSGVRSWVERYSHGIRSSNLGGGGFMVELAFGAAASEHILVQVDRRRSGVLEDALRAALGPGTWAAAVNVRLDEPQAETAIAERIAGMLASAIPQVPGPRNVLTPAQAVRRRPGMYVGDPGTSQGQESCLSFLLDRAVEEHETGTLGHVRVGLGAASIRVDDDGAGLAADQLVPAFLDPQHDLPPPPRLERINWLTVLTALSERTEVVSRHAGRQHRVVFMRGEVLEPVVDLGPAGSTGLSIDTTLDRTIFPGVPWERRSVHTTAEIAAATHPGLVVDVDGEGFHAPRGLLDVVVRHAAGRAFRWGPTHIRGRHRDTEVELAFGWIDGNDHFLLQLANQRLTRDGTHVSGFWRGLASAASTSVSQVRSRLRPGLIAAIHVVLPHPEWQQGDVLGARAAGGAVVSLLGESLSRDLTEQLSGL